MITIGDDFSFTDSLESKVTKSTGVLSLPIPIRIQIEDDDNPGEVEKFVLEVTNVLLMTTPEGRITEVFVNNLVTVVIVDDDGMLDT